MFNKVLVANRGEIACRIIRACHDLGARAVAVHSEADRDSLHVSLADEAVCIGTAQNASSYLDMPNVLMAAITSEADAVHPGYGYFSERENFADVLEAMGITFIGPPAAAIAMMGDKAAARGAAIEADCPVVPGSGGPVVSDEEAAAEADQIGYPLLIKAAAGGGGRGIRRVDGPEEFHRQLQTARHEAEASFGSGDMYLEKLIIDPRHVEIQIIADQYGNSVHLGERECSVQNLRRQKMVEEAPFAALDEETRSQMGESAVRLARSVGYVNAGTVEFLMNDSGDFFFIEMNTRLQVEHPVTEQVTGIDIVQAQIRVAAGEELPVSQHDVRWDGHAIEARITAEDSTRSFAPSCGTIKTWAPPEADDIRLETHVYEGFEITPFYDPMIGKLIVTSESRGQAVDRLGEALDAFEVTGIETNIPFLRSLVRHPRFVAGDVHTGFVGELMTQEVR